MPQNSTLEFSSQNDGVLPKVYKQKKEVCEIVKSYRRLDIQASHAHSPIAQK